MTPSWEIAAAYHERTKHHFHRSARSMGYLDWATQPDPFRRFEGATLLPLPFRRDEDRPAYDDLFAPGAVAASPVTLETVASLLELSLAISAWKEFQGSRWALRINPSSGNLHPTEGYLVVGPLAGLGDRSGVYHYAPREHALERRAQFDATLWAELMGDFPAGGFLVGLTSIHWREAWKYGERAYRYCQHDVGHALAAVSISAAVLGWRAVPVAQVGDADIASLLGLDRDADFADAEREQPDLLLAVIPAVAEASAAQENSNPASTGAIRHDVATGCALSAGALVRIAQAAQWSGRANRLSADHVEWEVIDEVAAACIKSAGIPGAIPSPQSEALPFSRPLSAAAIIRQRRSAVAFDGRTSITAGQFYRILDRTLPRYDRPPWTALGPPACVHMGLFVHLVEGLAPGLYALVRAADKEGELRAAMSSSFAWKKPLGCPDQLPLFLLEQGDARRMAAQVSCGQEIAGESAFSLGMIAEFERPLREYGAPFYRRLFWETGVIGQVLYLEAEAAGLRGTGIGCFFDDPVHDVFGLTGRAYQSLYHFTIGGPVEDTRLTTRPPYAEELVRLRTH